LDAFYHLGGLPESEFATGVNLVYYKWLVWKNFQIIKLTIM